MKGVLTSFLIVSILHVLAAFGWADGPPIAATHRLTAFSEGAAEVTLDYVLQVENRQDAVLRDLSCTLVPRPLFVTERAAVAIPQLGPDERTTLNLRVVAPLFFDRDQLSRIALAWACKCVDANGKVIEFPMKSVAGGDK